MCSAPLCYFRVGHYHVYTVYTQCFWHRNHQIYDRVRCTYTALANPSYFLFKRVNVLFDQPSYFLSERVNALFDQPFLFSI